MIQDEAIAMHKQAESLHGLFERFEKSRTIQIIAIDPPRSFPRVPMYIGSRQRSRTRHV